MTNKVDFAKIKVNETVEGCCLLAKIEKEDVASSGNPYIQISLNGDNNSQAKVCLFIKKDELKLQPPCVIKGKFTKTQKGDDCYINLANGFTACDEYSNDDFICTAPEDPEDCYNYIMKIVKANNYESENITLYDLTIAIMEKYKDKLLIYPAAQYIHHPYKGGLIYHIKKMVKIAYDLANDYKVDKEVVICSTILCVINKIYTLSLDEQFNATVNQFYYMENPGELSLKIIQKTATKLEIETGKRFDFYKKTNLEICIKSYRGTRRQGASITNLTKESCLVSTIHELDVDMYVYDTKKKETEYYQLSDYDNRIYTQVLNI